MELKWKKVKHTRHGEGIIENRDGDYLEIRFLTDNPPKTRIIKFQNVGVNLEFYDKQTESEIISILQKEKQKEKDRLKQKEAELMAAKELNYKKIEEIIEQKRIKKLVHFTKIDNIANILKHGLVPIKTLLEKGIRSSHNDYLRIESMHDCTSFSIEFPNYKLFKKFRVKYPKANWAVIELKPDILLSRDNIAYFCYTNAAAKEIKEILSSKRKKELQTAEAFQKMFANPLETKEGKLNRDHRYDKNWPTDSQAEILISGIIDKKYIVRICFQSGDAKKQFVNKNHLHISEENMCCYTPYYWQNRFTY